MSTNNRELASKAFADSLKAGEYDKELEAVLLNWQVENAQTRITDFLDTLNGKYDGERLSVANLNQNSIDELLALGRESYAETRRAYLKANLEQYLHDLKYVATPSIYITEQEWSQIHSGEILGLEVARTFATKKIDELAEGLSRVVEALDATEPVDATELTTEQVTEPARRGRKPKVD